MKYERLVSEYERLAGSSLDENLKIATLIRCCPNQLRQHLQLNVKPGMKYEQIRQSMVAYEQTTTSWSAQKILEYSEVQPMEVDRVKGDSKGKGKKGKGKNKGSKGKGFKGDKGKGKGPFQEIPKEKEKVEERARVMRKAKVKERDPASFATRWVTKLLTVGNDMNEFSRWRMGSRKAVQVKVLRRLLHHGLLQRAVQSLRRVQGQLAQ